MNRYHLIAGLVLVGSLCATPGFGAADEAAPTPATAAGAAAAAGEPAGPATSRALGQGPDSETLRARFLLELPGYWALDDFSVEAQVNYGSEVMPDIRSRFSAEVALRHDTFALAEQEGVVSWLTPVASEGDTRRVFGMASSTWREGAWNIDFTLENNPMPRLGQPRDFFSGRTLVRGTDEEATWLAELALPRRVEEEQRHAAEVERRAREMELAEQEHQAELQRTRHAEEAAAAEREAEARAAAAAEAAAEAALATLAERSRTALAFELPGYWRLAELELGDGVAEGEALVQRFEATIELTTPTYLEQETAGPVVLVVPAAEAETRRELFGAVRWHRDGDDWQSSFELENDPIEGLGRPLDFFAGRVLVAGSPEAAEWRALEQAETAARLEEEAELAELARQAELAELAHAERVDEAISTRRASERAAIIEELRARLGIDLPGYWHVADLAVQEEVWEDDDRVQLALALEVELAADTFAPGESDGEVLLIERVAAAGEKRTIHGAGTAQRDDDGWHFTIETRNAPLDGLGQPRDYFEERVLIQGSDEAEAYLEAQHQAAVDRLRRAQELRAEEMAAEMAEAEHQQRLEAERQKLERARLTFAEALADERAAQEVRLAERARQRDDVQVRAMVEQLANADSLTRTHILGAAARSDDPRLRHLALSDVLQKSSRLPFQLTVPEGDSGTNNARMIQQLGPFSVDIAQYEPASGRISGQFITNNLRDQEVVFSGTVSGDRIAVASSVCQLDGRLQTDGSLRGSLTCRTGRIPSGRAVAIAALF